MKTNKNHVGKLFLTILLSISFLIAFPDKITECKPVVSYGSLKGVCSASKNKIPTDKFITCTCENTKFEIVSFEVTATVSGQTKIAVCRGMGISVDALAIIASARTGSKIFIDAVKIKDVNGNIKIVPGLTITITA